MRFAPGSGVPAATAETTAFTPAGDISASNVQAAVLEAEAQAKAYSLALVNGLDIKPSTRVATMVPLPANTRSGNVLLADADGPLPAQDGTVSCNVGDRVIVNAEAIAANNGIYVIDSTGGASARWQMTRAPDADESAEVTSGLVASALEGSSAPREWILITPDPIVLNTSPLNFQQFSPYPRDVLVGTNGATSGDVVTTAGSALADASVNYGAKLLSVGTGVGGTYSEKLYVIKNGEIRSNTGIKLRTTQSDGPTRTALAVDTPATWVNPAATLLSVQNGDTPQFEVSLDGALRQSGLDTTGTPGNCTVHKPCGVATIAAGATACIITNNLVPDPAVEKVRFHFTFHGDHGAARSWGVQTLGAFTVYLSSPASVNTDFSWVGAKLLPHP